jgi:uncharacterized protein
MKILVASDLHGKQQAREALGAAVKRFENELDLIILCGDITTFEGKEKALKMVQALGTELPVLAVPGNCDPPEVLDGVETAGAVNLHRKRFEKDGHVFIGYGGANSHNHYGCTSPEVGNILEELIGNTPPEKLHFVFHMPPFCHLNSRLGNPLFLELVKKYRPQTVFSGHVHEAKGVDQSAYTMFVNPGPAAGGHFAVIEITDEGAKVVHSE